MKEKILIWLAWHMPKELVKWAAVRLMASATVNEYSDQIVSELTCLDALQRW